MNPKEFSDWCERNSIASKLTAALENVSVGRGWAPFNGLESGETTIKVVHDGVNIVFLSDYKGVPGFDEPAFQGEEETEPESKKEDLEKPSEAPETLKEKEFADLEADQTSDKPDEKAEKEPDPDLEADLDARKGKEQPKKKKLKKK